MDIRAPHPWRRLKQLWRRHVSHPFVEGRDGFWAFDPASRAVNNGMEPGACARIKRAPTSPLDPVLEFCARNKRGETVQIPLGPQTFTGRSGKWGETFVPLAMAQPLLQSLPGLDPRRGGTLTLQVEAADSQATDTSRVLAMPSNYDGPLFVCDIDNTLRNTRYSELITGHRQPPIQGASPLLAAIAAMGVPILYLSAGTSRFHLDNQRFLEQVPPGVLLDRDHMSLADLDPTNHAQARRQADYKLGVLHRLAGAFPQAQLFEIGDDKYGDAMAYQQIGAKAYIHDVKPSHKNIPPDFRGVLTRDYDPRFQALVLGDLANAIAHSGSYGGETLPWRGLPGERPPFDVVLRQRLVGTPAEVAQVVEEQLGAHHDGAALSAALPDDVLSQLPVGARACMADDCLRAKDGAQFLRLLNAVGTATDIDSVLHAMELSHHIVDALPSATSMQVMALLDAHAPVPGDWAGFDTYRQQGGTPMLRAIDTAQQRIRMATTELQDPDVVNHLEVAAQRGVDIELLLPTPADGLVADEAGERAVWNALADTQHVRILVGAPTADVAIFDGARSVSGGAWSEQVGAAEQQFAHMAASAAPTHDWRPGLFSAVVQHAAWRSRLRIS